MLYRVSFTARSPLAFVRHRTGANYRSSSPYIHGASLYGALGSRCFDPELFLALRCHNAYPARTHDSWVRPLPFTAVREDTHRIIDILTALVCWEQQQPPSLVYVPLDQAGHPLPSASWPFYTLVADAITPRSIDRRIVSTMEINPYFNTVERGRSSSLLAISEVTAGAASHFCGSIVLPDDAHEILDAMKTIRQLGARQSVGLGLVDITIESVQPETGGDIAQRIDHLTDRFRTQTDLYRQLGGSAWSIRPRTILTISLISDTILFEQGWMPTYVLSAALLTELTGIRVRLVRAFTRTTIVSGWHMLWQQPKPSALAIAMGSLFVFEAEQSVTATDCQALATLQLQGIGDRCQEGFGQIRVCDEFHLREHWPLAFDTHAMMSTN